ncbi:hypothetical protein [Mycobacterium fragae]|uniref:hypothetical protein n=1 Tax=Mycobacterium fragae TaxID=1260918 RepID=UPI001D0BD9B0|nr:hypothetical protein [Mycobacterium fragae]
MSKRKLEEAITEADEIEAAEDHQNDRPLPPHVKVSRPGRARSKVLQVRLNPDEFEALERIAERRQLPVSTIARGQLLQLITADEPAGNLSLLRAALGNLDRAREAVAELAEAEVRPRARRIKSALPR